MDSVNERLRLFFEKNKIDQAGTAKKLNVSPQRQYIRELPGIVTKKAPVRQLTDQGFPKLKHRIN